VQEALVELRQLLGRPIEPRRPAAVSLEEEARRLGVELEGDAPIPAGAEGLAAHVLAEAARNARKHAAPTRVVARLADTEDAWVMEVVNDGVRGRPSAPPGMGLRLAALEALQVGGLVEFGPAGGDRWRVRLAVPHD
jgi:signal transduction histidine kinase